MFVLSDYVDPYLAFNLRWTNDLEFLLGVCTSLTFIVTCGSDLGRCPWLISVTCCLKTPSLYWHRFIHSLTFSYPLFPIFHFVLSFVCFCVSKISLSSHLSHCFLILPNLHCLFYIFFHFLPLPFCSHVSLQFTFLPTTSKSSIFSSLSFRISSSFISFPFFLTFLFMLGHTHPNHTSFSFLLPTPALSMLLSLPLPHPPPHTPFLLPHPHIYIRHPPFPSLPLACTT